MAKSLSTFPRHNMRYSLNSLKGVIWRLYGEYSRVIRLHAGSLDSSSYGGSLTASKDNPLQSLFNSGGSMPRNPTLDIQAPCMQPVFDAYVYKPQHNRSFHFMVYVCDRLIPDHASYEGPHTTPPTLIGRPSATCPSSFWWLAGKKGIEKKMETLT